MICKQRDGRTRQKRHAVEISLYHQGTIYETHQKQAVNRARLDEQRKHFHHARLLETVAERPAQQPPVYPIVRRVNHDRMFDDEAYTPGFVAY